MSRGGHKGLSHQSPQAYFNPLPTPLEHLRPALTLFGWGSGSDNQLGVGPIPDFHKNEWDKPKRNTFVEQMAAEGAFGVGGAGLEAVAAGGMHSLAIDENGTVSKQFTVS
jgi:regulator of chromosome condensation